VVAGAVAPDAPRPSRRIRLDQLAGLLTVPAGCALDLGATAKAWTADRAASDIAARLGCSVLVEIGGDLAVAGPPRQWQIAVGERAGVPGQQVSLTSGGMATSTTTVRRWPHGGRMVHHVIDPATGRSADGPWRTATVAARSAVLANCRSTAAIVLGAAALAWLTEQRADGRLVGVDGTTRTVGRWPEPAGPAPACPTAGSIYTRVAAEASSERS